MEIIQTVEELKNYRKSITNTIGFVPTMGALHEGHISLIKNARKECDNLIVSVFVNPTQFLAGEDLDKYPKKTEADIKICELAGVDAIFMPNISDMYHNHEEINILAPNSLGYILEGHKRPGHFDGVLRIVLKLFNLIQPSHAYFGKKDAQQLTLIKQMVNDLFLPIRIIEGETIREKSGLALSSRNAYLSEEEKKEALAISFSLKRAAKLFSSGINDSNKIENEMRELTSNLDVEYIEIVDREFNKIKTLELNNTIIVVAAKVGTTRLIDNIWL